MTRALSLPLLVVTATYALTSRNWPLAGLVGTCLLLLALLRGRLALGAGAQRLLVLGSGIVAALALGSLLPLQMERNSTTLSRAAQVFGGALLVAALAHASLRKPFGGSWFTLVLALLALTACGRAKSGYLYAGACVAFASLGLYAVNRARSRPDLNNSKRQLLLALAVLVTAGTCVACVLALPRAYSWAIRQAASQDLDRVGFNDRLWLGSMRGLLSSDTPVMRLRGRHQDLLRGVVYTSYTGGEWRREPSDVLPTQPVPDAPASGPEYTHIEFVAGFSERYFLPLHAANLGASAGALRADDYGVFRPVLADFPGEIWFTRGAAAPAERALPSGVETADHGVPKELRGALKQLATAWTSGATQPRQQLELLEAKLKHDFHYSLNFEIGSRVDPTWQFLTQTRLGHCEYFASALALLGRSLAIPTRVVSGYRVAEYNTLGHYYMVRERDAHTWVEALLPGQGWTTFDPTPAVEFNAEVPLETPLFSALWDLGRQLGARFLTWLDQRSWFDIVSVLVGLLLLNALLRAWNGRKQRRAHAAAVRLDQALPCFENLSLALKRRRLVRAPAETLEAFGQRLSDARLSEAERERTSALLLDYSALRFGHVVDAARVVAAMERLTADLNAAGGPETRR